MFQREHSRVIDIESGGHKDDQNLLTPTWHHHHQIANGDISAQTTITSDQFYRQSSDESNGARFFR